jgi:hypothetical protein
MQQKCAASCGCPAPDFSRVSSPTPAEPAPWGKLVSVSPQQGYQPQQQQQQYPTQQQGFPPQQQGFPPQQQGYPPQLQGHPPQPSYLNTPTTANAPMTTQPSVPATTEIKSPVYAPYAPIHLKTPAYAPAGIQPVDAPTSTSPIEAPPVPVRLSVFPQPLYRDHVADRVPADWRAPTVPATAVPATPWNLNTPAPFETPMTTQPTAPAIAEIKAPTSVYAPTLATPTAPATAVRRTPWYLNTPATVATPITTQPTAPAIAEIKAPTLVYAPMTSQPTAPAMTETETPATFVAPTFSLGSNSPMSKGRAAFLARTSGGTAGVLPHATTLLAPFAPNVALAPTRKKSSWLWKRSHALVPEGGEALIAAGERTL